MTAGLLAPLREAPERSALIFDVDGTLAPIASRPELAEVPPATKTELERLSGRYLLVAFVSGRSGEEARRLVGLDGVRYVGNHGLELDSGAHELQAQVAAFRDTVERKVEDKGLTLSYHFREALDEAEARAELEEVARRAAAEGLVPHWGRKVLEIRPAVDADKGTAVQELVREAGARRALYAGDDTTDLDAFAALADGSLEHVVRVAVSSEEAPPGLAAAADLVVEGTPGLAEILTQL
jgi:trehalose 6-phosphate phosphatase